jgi:wyosine [tRNA(Phe)-imidazoG37] synthetase (radical SAM superfamily)
MSQERTDSTPDASRRLLVKEGLVYGPLDSRRLGRSLGVNLLGFGEKLCSFNCRYCQCGWTKCPTMEVGQRNADLPSVEIVTSELERELRQLSGNNLALDVITFSGNGEPTLHPELEAIVKAASALRDHYAPGSKLAILSNSSTVHRPEVRAALEFVDLKIMKLDAGTETLMRRINLPARGFDFARMLQGLAELEGVILQSMFVSGSVDNTDPSAVREWIRRIMEIDPLRVQVYSLDRTPPDPRLQRVPRGLLDSIAYYASWRTSVPIDVF